MSTTKRQQGDEEEEEEDEEEAEEEEEEEEEDDDDDDVDVDEEEVDLNVTKRGSTIKKRPLSYPWGPETRLEFVHVDDDGTTLTTSSYANVSDTKLTTTSLSDPIKLTGCATGGGAGGGGGGDKNSVGRVGGGGSVYGYGGVKERVKVQVKPFTKESLERLERKTVQLVREYGFQPRRKLSVEDGSRLPGKYEPFPPTLYGRPLEEIDNFIYDEVRLN